MPTISRQKNVTKANTGSVIDRIGPIEVDKWIKINLYGLSGSGKTTLWSTFPKPILAIVCSSLKNPGELKSINTAENRKVIEKVVLQQSQEIRDLTNWAIGSKFKTITLDHASGLQDMVLREILGLEELPPQLSWGLVTRQQYGQAALKMKEFLRAMLDLPKNVVIVAQERDFSKEEDGIDGEVVQPFIASALMPSVVGWLNPACDYVCQMYKKQKYEEVEIKVAGKISKQRKAVKGVDYVLRTTPGAVYASKFRIPRDNSPMDDLIDPSYDKIVKLLDQ